MFRGQPVAPGRVPSVLAIVAGSRDATPPPPPPSQHLAAFPPLLPLSLLLSPSPPSPSLPPLSPPLLLPSPLPPSPPSLPPPSALALYDSDGPGDKLFVDALKAGVAVRCFAGWCLWFMGHPDRALVRIREAVALARRLSEPHGLAHALFFAAVLHQLRRERSMAEQRAEEVVVLAGEHGLGLYGAAARIVRGWALLAAAMTRMPPSRCARDWPRGKPPARS